MNQYAHPEYLVETSWVLDHLEDPTVRMVESDEDYLLYETGHIPGAVKIDWFTTLQHPIRRDFISKSEFEDLCSKNGITNDTTVVFYGDKNNWFASYTFWIFEYYGHEKRKMMNGGRAKWVREGLPLTQTLPTYSPTGYCAQDPDTNIRSFRDEVLAHSQARRPLIDVRTPLEYSGELIHMPNYPQEGAQRGGHIPGAVNIPWSKALDENTGQFKSADELEDLFQAVRRDDTVITYCRIGERSSITWFALKYLLGYEQVKNYDGSWTEWGNLVGAPIEKGSPA